MTDHELHAFWDDALQMIERELLPHFMICLSGHA